VLNVFRCDNLDCQALLSEAPAVLDFLDEESKKHFTNILEALDELGVPYQLNPLYAGPDGFGKTNLVIKSKLKGETVVLGEGGYHEGLMQNLCGKIIPALALAAVCQKSTNFWRPIKPLSAGNKTMMFFWYRWAKNWPPKNLCACSAT